MILVSVAAKICAKGISVLRETDPDWWPRRQSDRTVLAQSMAMAWVERDKLGRQGNEVWVSTCWSRSAPLQAAMLKRYGVVLPEAGEDYAPNGNR